MSTQPAPVAAVNPTAATPRDAQPFVVERPGIYLEVPDDVYHADPVPGGSLSSSGARDLLPPSCPALFRHKRDNPQPTKAVFDEGKAAHHLVLGAGPELVVVARERWDTNEVKAQVKAIREAGGIPLKQAVYDRVVAMAAALREHPLAGKLLQPGTGEPEVSLFWRDKGTGVKCRGRVDWMPHAHGGRLIVPDYKTCASAAPEDLTKAIHRFGLHVQEAFYLRGIRALVTEDVEFVFIFQSKEAPYLVTVAGTDHTAKRIGDREVSEALRLYRECSESGRWHGFHDDDVAVLSLPSWVERQYDGEVW